MSREVEGLDNLNRILELPLGSKFGMFVDGSMNSTTPNSERKPHAHHHSPDLHHRPPHLPQVILNQL